MTTSTKSKRRTSGSKAPVKTEKSASKRLKVAARSVKSAKRPVVVVKIPPIPAVTPPVDSYPAYTKAVAFLMSHTDYEKMRVVRYNTTTFNLDRMRTLLKHLG